jgi:hypothetical protein
VLTRADSSSFEAPSSPSHTSLTIHTHAHVSARTDGSFTRAATGCCFLSSSFLSHLLFRRSRRRFSFSSSFFSSACRWIILSRTCSRKRKPMAIEYIGYHVSSFAVLICQWIHRFLASPRSPGRNRRRQDALETRRIRTLLVNFRRNEREEPKSSGPYGSCRCSERTFVRPTTCRPIAIATNAGGCRMTWGENSRKRVPHSRSLLYAEVLPLLCFSDEIYVWNLSSICFAKSQNPRFLGVQINFLLFCNRNLRFT